MPDGRNSFGLTKYARSMRGNAHLSLFPAAFGAVFCFGDLAATSTPDMASTAADDSFELYDLRVEVVIPEGKRIMCGAKEGDHFVLEGEMLRLPPGQGFSIYSLCKGVHPLDDNEA